MKDSNKISKITCVDRSMTIMLYILVFLLLAPAFGSQSLPLYDYPVWHDLFSSMASGPFLQVWNHCNELIGKQGRFMPLYFVIQAVALRQNSLPQIGYWILCILVALINVTLIVFLSEQLSGSRKIGIISGAFFTFTPYTIATYWSSIHAESFQVSFLLAFISGSLLFVCQNRSRLFGVAAMISYGLALFLKESSVFLLPCAVLWCVMAIHHKHALKRSLALALGILLVTLGWWLCRLHYLCSADSDSYGQKLLSTQLPACFKTFLIYMCETVVVAPALLLVIPVILWVVFVETFRRGRPSEPGSPRYQAAFVFMVFAAWAVGLSFISQIVIRYELPVICLGIILAVSCFSIIHPKLRKLCAVLMALAFISSVTGTVAARSILIQWTRCEGDLIRRIAELPEDATVFCATMYPSSGERFAQKIQWSLQRWFARKDVSVQALNSREELPPNSYLVVAGEKWASEWCNFGWHPGEADTGLLPKRFELSTLNAVNSIGFKSYGWQVRGWHILVLCERILKRDNKPGPPLGLIQYQANFDFYHRSPTAPDLNIP
jgi:hypothetical protein